MQLRLEGDNTCNRDVGEDAAHGRRRTSNRPRNTSTRKRSGEQGAMLLKIDRTSVLRFWVVSLKILFPTFRDTLLFNLKNKTSRWFEWPVTFYRSTGCCISQGLDFHIDWY
jgi:hypothetical protein